MGEEKTARKVFESLTPEIIKTYQIRLAEDNDKIQIHHPAYISVQHPKLERDDITTALKNKKVWVTLWNTVESLHITVY